MDVPLDLAAHLRRLEEELLRPATRGSRTELEARLAPDFAEIGRSGRIHDRAAIVTALAAGAGDEPAVARLEDFAVRLLAPGIVLATYRSVGDGAAGSAPVVALRSSIWRRDDSDWRMVFHHGTPAAQSPGPGGAYSPRRRRTSSSQPGK